MPILTWFSFLKVGKYGSLIPQIRDIVEKMPEYGGHCPVQFVFMVDFFLFTVFSTELWAHLVYKPKPQAAWKALTAKIH